MRKLTTALIGAAILAVSFSAAEARPRHHHHHHHARVAKIEVTAPQEQSFFGGFQQGFSAGGGFVQRARQFVGDTAHEVGVRSSLWCSAFLRKVTGAQDVDDRALSWEKHQHIAPQVGAVVTMGRRGGGHVGIVSGFTKNGDPIVISGNHGHRVAESVYPRSRIRAWVSPT
ncbi:CHAP domain-containing protein [Bradyrhizobium sp. DASA03007]|uniref:CHAP domain-containing protein n=1 Tax=unclassified Bradyrhizobium TaxID=2631580 RepID=UPI003F72DDCE